MPPDPDPAPPRPAAGELLALALAGESLLALLALAWSRVRDLPLRAGAGPWIGHAAAGAASAAALAAVNWWILRRAPAVRVVRALRRVFREVLDPLFANVGMREVVVVSLAAGIGEELAFRGALQPEIGLIPASLVFGALHTGGRGTLVFGAWAAVMGAALGGLAAATGGLLAPVVAHALYDAAALAWIRHRRVRAPAAGDPSRGGGG